MVSLVGVAVAEGGIVATTADLLTGIRQVSVVASDGHEVRAPVIAMDPGSDVALVDVPEDLPVARFADDGALTAGTADLTLGLVPGGHAGAMALHCTPGAVSNVAQPIASGPAGGLASITSATSPLLDPSVAAPPTIGGAPLLDSAGAVVGILYPQPSSTGATTTFLPSELVTGVADDLRSRQKVLHGWLGISGTDAPSGGGALVDSVDPKGPSAGRVLTGLVIVGVDSLPVRTMAELRARLYVLDPGQPVTLSVQQASGAKQVVDVTLAGSS
jgi:S1-C subfamily serine protease